VADRTRRGGFTILELVVALIIAGIISAAIASSLSQLGRAREAARLRMTATRRASDALEALRRDIQSAVRSSDLFLTRFRLAGEVVRSEGRELDRDQMLLFSERLKPTRTLDYTGEGQEYETQYRIESDDGGPALWRRRDPVPDEYEAAGGVAEPVGEGVVSLRLEAYDGTEWRQDWDSDSDGLPRAVRATVTASGARVGESTLEDARALVTLRTEIPIDRVATPDAPEPEEEPGTGTDPAATGDPMEGGAAQATPGAIVGGDGGGGGAITGGGGGGKGSGMRPGGPGRGPGGGMGRGGGNGRGGGPGRGGRGGGVPFRPPGGGGAQ
jgi:type II secretion system protein J